MSDDRCPISKGGVEFRQPVGVGHRSVDIGYCSSPLLLSTAPLRGPCMRRAHLLLWNRLPETAVFHDANEVHPRDHENNGT